ncbi:spermidine/putrescine ABC transporter permease [Aureimonas sp. SA4125]|uniref:ABC transporter permease n=1 Tax=Aureimonas sp. SA4125 TaxID=2826993 RepID=UPI001CC7230E|nr:ABC transporter permease [Aureimonas sp. SA4125]BDA84888.1 spermidine/putrescine ABC transporter permease [Aureimonas sp. SA4125]
MTTKLRSPSETLRFGLFLGTPTLIWQVAFFLVPLGFLVAMTFWSVRSFRLTPDFTLANWTMILNAGFFRSAFVYTFLMSLLAGLIASLAAFPVAYALTFRVSPGLKRLLVFMLVVPFFTSFPVRVYSMQIFFSPSGIINTALAPLGLGPISVLNSPTGTMIGFLTLTAPLVILLQTIALGAVDRQLIEAAHNLRCGRLRTIFTVIIPSARVGLVVAGAFAFVLAFGDYISPQFLGGSNPPTLSILIADQVKSGNHWPRASVVAVIMIATLMLVLGVLLKLAYGGRRAAR